MEGYRVRLEYHVEIDKALLYQRAENIDSSGGLVEVRAGVAIYLIFQGSFLFGSSCPSRRVGHCENWYYSVPHRVLRERAIAESW
jgi:hypothetical protein